MNQPTPKPVVVAPLVSPLTPQNDTLFLTILATIETNFIEIVSLLPCLFWQRWQEVHLLWAILPAAFWIFSKSSLVIKSAFHHSLKDSHLRATQLADGTLDEFKLCILVRNWKSDCKSRWHETLKFLVQRQDFVAGSCMQLKSSLFQAQKGMQYILHHWVTGCTWMYLKQSWGY